MRRSTVLCASVFASALFASPLTAQAAAPADGPYKTIIKEKSPTSFEVEQNLQTKNGARTVTLDYKTGHLFTMAQEYGAPPTPPATPPAGGRGGGRGPVVPGSFTILMIGQ